MRHRWVTASAVALFLVLAAPGVAGAYWSTSATAAASVAAAGSGQMAQTGFGSLAFVYGDPSALRVTAPVTVTNTGDSAATYTMALGRQAANGLTSAVAIRSWKVSSVSLCDNGDGEGGNAQSGTWNSMPAQTGTLGPGSSEIVCYRMSITSAQAASLAGSTMTGTLTLRSSDLWSTPVTADISQSVAADTIPPTTPTGLTASGTTSNQTTLKWTPSTDNVTSGPSLVYEIVWGSGSSGLISTTMNPVTFTVPMLSPNTTYVFTVRAKDRAGNYSGIASVTVTTLPALNPQASVMW